MRHDYVHCLDYRDSCPRSCFRGKLVREVRQYGEYARSAFGHIVWGHLKGTEECRLYRRRKMRGE